MKAEYFWLFFLCGLEGISVITFSYNQEVKEDIRHNKLRLPGDGFFHLVIKESIFGWVRPDHKSVVEFRFYLKEMESLDSTSKKWGAIIDGQVIIWKGE